MNVLPMEVHNNKNVCVINAPTYLLQATELLGQTNLKALKGKSVDLVPQAASEG